MFTAALPVTAKIWEQPKDPLTDEWIKIHIYIGMKLFSKRNSTIYNYTDKLSVI